MSTPAAGRVYLVGAGPGDPGLITVRGMECLHQADLILYDGLVNPLLLLPVSAQVERTCRVDGPAGRRLPQAEINARLVSAARSGKTVVRLKGGDPFVFGRGSEEAAALRAAGIPFEVVPGITAAVAACAYAGISVTHRDHASAVAFITGHEDPLKSDTTLDYDVLARFPGTLVFYMGLHRLPSIAESLIRSGKPPDVPVAVISRGTTPLQQTVTAPLQHIAESVRQAGLHAPSLIVVGSCVQLREQIAWFESRPLFGQRIAVTRAAQQAAEVVAKLLERGAQPILFPTIEITPPADWAQVDNALARLETFDWVVFTSTNGVDHLLGRLWSTGGDMRKLSRVRLAAIGPGTAARLAQFHLRADLVPTTFRAEALADALAPHVAGKSVLWARASRGRDVLIDALRAAGARLEEVVVYENVDVSRADPSVLAACEAGELDWICLSSPSIARSVQRLLTPAARDRLGRGVRVASISPVTSEAARQAGLSVHAEARTYTWDGLLDAIGEVVANERRGVTGGE